MKEIKVSKYQCDKCGTMYSNAKEANECEKQPITKDKGAKIGDEVIITQGDGTGQRAIVESIFVYNKSWGHYAWKTYWHTIGLDAKIKDSWGNRQLTFDSYKMTK